MGPVQSTFTIGELATRAQSAVETIRFYERGGLLPSPDRSSGNYRMYDELHVERLVFIRRCRLLDLSLDDIQFLLKLRKAPAESCSEVNAILDQHLFRVAQRIDELGCLRTQLKKLLARCRAARSVKGCRILKELARDEQTSPERRPDSRERKAQRSRRTSRSLVTL